MFWDELSAYIEEIHPAVDDQRHSNVLHIPIAISLHHLRDTIKEGLHQKCRKASVHHWSGYGFNFGREICTAQQLCIILASLTSNLVHKLDS